MSEHLAILTGRFHGGQGRSFVKIEVCPSSLGMSLIEQQIRDSDLDISYVISVDSCQRLEEGLRLEFAKFNYWRSSDTRQPVRFLSHDDNGRAIAQRMIEFACSHRFSFGDDGTWRVWTCRDLLLKRPGINLSGVAHAEQRQSLPVKVLPDADYTDELGSFRFPSTSCLYGVSQPISLLRGSAKFRKLFIRDGAGVYVAFDDDEVLYVGMSQRFSQRLSNAESHHKLKHVLEHHPQARVAVIHYPFWKLPALNDALTPEEKEKAWGRIRALLFGLERSCIEYYRPIYNGTLDDGTSEPIAERAAVVVS